MAGVSGAFGPNSMVTGCGSSPVGVSTHRTAKPPRRGRPGRVAVTSGPTACSLAPTRRVAGDARAHRLQLGYKPQAVGGTVEPGGVLVCGSADHCGRGPP